jgi:hypothetical protein
MNGTPKVGAYVAKPEGAAPFPVVIMIHEFFGLNESIISKADGLAAEGYLVVAPIRFAARQPRGVPGRFTRSSPPSRNRSISIWIQSMPGWKPNRLLTAPGLRSSGFILVGVPRLDIACITTSWRPALCSAVLPKLTLPC